LEAKYVRVVMKDIVQGLVHMNERGWCHRDLKLENIMLDENNHSVLIDLGFGANLEGDDEEGEEDDGEGEEGEEEEDGEAEGEGDE